MKKYFTDNSKEKGWLKLKGTTLGHDKQKHIVLGVVVFIVFYIVLKEAVFSITDAYELRLTALENAFGATFAIAVAKEVYDFVLFKMGKKPNWIPVPDIIVTVLIPFIIILISKFF